MRLNAVSWGLEDRAHVVCVHGVTSHAHRFEALARLWLDQYHVTSVDLRGHGESSWDPPWDALTHVRDLLETVTLPAVWVGHSFGGLLVAMLAEVAPERVRRAVLLEPAIGLPPDLARSQADAVRQDRTYPSLDDYIEEKLSSGTIFRASRGSLQEELKYDLSPSAQGLEARFSRSAAVVAWSEMSAHSPPYPACPTLVVTGERSWVPAVPATEPHVRQVVAPGGHSLLWDALEETGRAITSFLDDTART